MNGSLSLVVVSFNTRDLLQRCLEAVSDCAAEIVVVDNASSDGSTGLVRDRFPEVQLIAMPENRGFGAAANRGIRASRGSQILLLNADAWPTEGAVERLVECAGRRQRTAMLGPQLVDLEGRRQRSVIRHPAGGLSLAVTTAFPRSTSRVYSVWNNLTRARRSQGVGEGQFLMGAVLLLQRKAFEEVGAFDESFFMFNEEVDLSLRLRQAGWRIEFCPQAVFVHAGGASTRLAEDQMERERLRSHLRFMAKYGRHRDVERSRRLLVLALRLRRRRVDAAWLAATPLTEILRSRR